MQQSQTARKNYIQAEVHTATPQKLQLLLVEAAIKNIHRTKQSWKESRFDVALDTLSRAQDIVAEILCSLDVEGNPDIAKRLASIYLFIFRRLAEGGMTNDEEKLDDALRVLNSERETWKQVCEKFGSTVGPASSGASEPIRSAIGDSVEYTPSTGAKTGADASSRLDLAGNGARVLVPPAGSAASTTFSRPVGAGSFGTGVKPLGASPIQTDATLAAPKTDASANSLPARNGFYMTTPGPGNLSNLSTATKPDGGSDDSGTPVASSTPTGHNWEV